MSKEEKRTLNCSIPGPEGSQYNYLQINMTFILKSELFSWNSIFLFILGHFFSSECLGSHLTHASVTSLTDNVPFLQFLTIQICDLFSSTGSHFFFLFFFLISIVSVKQKAPFLTDNKGPDGISN